MRGVGSSLGAPYMHDETVRGRVVPDSLYLEEETVEGDRLGVSHIFILLTQQGENSAPVSQQQGRMTHNLVITTKMTQCEGQMA